MIFIVHFIFQRELKCICVLIYKLTTFLNLMAGRQFNFIDVIIRSRFPASTFIIIPNFTLHKIIPFYRF